MAELECVAEPYSLTGGLAAAGFYKLLGRPKLDPLTVLVRETAQNSWDARLGANAPVEFRIEGWSPLYDSEIDALRSSVFAGHGKTKTDLKKVLSAKSTDALFIIDRGTRGLGGPTLANEVSGNGVYDWVDFVLNVGKQSTEEQSGGTYGFGKTITYIVSKANAIVIHSRTRYRGKLETRLIACAIGDEFEKGNRLYTGRFWWGKAVEGGGAAPLTGSRADDLAAEIGMPPFEEDETGTNIMVLAPDFGGRTPKQAMQFIAESATWHLWPKLMKRPGARKRPMNIEITFNNELIEIPSPEQRPPLHGFAQAFAALLEDVPEGRRADGLERKIIRVQRPIATAGDLVMVPLVSRARADVDDGHDPTDPDSPEAAAVINGACHHVALLRAPELVVDYMPGPPPVEGGTEWAAVFRCRPEVDAHFSASEPPTHDSWRPDLLEKSQGKTIVKVSLERMRDALRERWGPTSTLRSAPQVASTSVVADELAGLVRDHLGSGPGRPPRPKTGGSGSATRTAKAELVSAGVEMYDGRPVAAATIKVQPAIGQESTHVEVEIGVALEGGGAAVDLDPELRLILVKLEEDDIALEGLTAGFEVVGGAAQTVKVLADRGRDSAVEFSVRAVGR